MYRSAEEIAKKLAFNETKAEVKFKAICRQFNIPFSFQYIIKTKYSFFIADFLITNKEGKKYIVEIDGGYHETWKQKQKDKKRSSKLRMKGYGVIRFKNDDLLLKPDKTINKLKRFNIL